MNKQESHRPVESIELDRLVDGELSESDQQSLIRRLDSQPDGWRECALAFLESQSWSQHLIGESATVPAAKIRQLGPVDLQRVNLPAKQRDASAWPSAIGWLATAAALVVAFTLGQQASPVHQIADGDRAAVAPASEVVARDALPEPKFGLPAATEEWLATSQVPVDVRQVIQRMGADLQQEQGWLLRRDRNGNQIVVPYRDVQIVPVNNPL